MSTSFEPINAAFGRVFRPGELSLGLVVPIERYPHTRRPTLRRHLERVQLAEQLGFAAVWLRDVPFDVPAFGDTGQVYDPFVYLGALAATTERIGLGVASIVLPLRHPAHVAKAAASVDRLSGGRVLLGVASGDRPDEYPAFGASFADRSERFRDSYAYLRAIGQRRPRHDGRLGTLDGRIELLPRPVGPRLPVLITGSSRQTPAWVAEHGDGWMTYPRDLPTQARVVADYRKRVALAEQPPKPVMQSLYVDLVDDDGAAPQPIHLGFRSGMAYLREVLLHLRSVGVNHVAINLRFASAPIEPLLERLANDLLPTLAPRETP